MADQFKTDFAGDFRKREKAARRAAGREVGAKVAQARKAALVENNGARKLGKKVGSRRKKAVRFVVGADGTLVVLDLYPHAEHLESGKTITSARKMFVPRGKPQAPGEKPFFIKNGPSDLVFASKPGAKKNDKARLIGVMTNQIQIRPIRKEGRLHDIAARHLDQYLDAVDKHMWK